MSGKTTILFAVTNELNYDQRMIRICHSLAKVGYTVELIGAGFADSPALQNQPYAQKRLLLKHRKGKQFYISYNRKLFNYLRERVQNDRSSQLAICAIDLDTILPVWLICRRFPHIIPIYDAHEFFTEQYEIKRRPWIKAAWTALERMCLPAFPNGYTVNQTLADLFGKRYGHHYTVIRNMPVLHLPSKNEFPPAGLPEKFILYQGAVNEGRAFDQLIPALQKINIPLVICGEGNYLNQVKSLVEVNGMEKKVLFLGRIPPEELRKITPYALMGLTLFDKKGINQFHSLANRFFDYIMAGIPQVCVDFPEYRLINEEHNIALMCPSPDSDTIAGCVNKLLHDNVLYQTLQQNCVKVRHSLNWESEQDKLYAFWKSIFISANPFT